MVLVWVGEDGRGSKWSREEERETGMGGKEKRGGNRRRGDRE